MLVLRRPQASQGAMLRLSCHLILMMSEVVLKLFMFYHPIQPLRCGNKSSPVIRINLPGAASPRDEPFEMLDELLSCLVWQQLQGTALVKLQANNKIYAFPSFFVLTFYPIGPAKSRLTNSKGTDPSVLSVGNFPAGGFGKAVTWNFLHP